MARPILAVSIALCALLVVQAADVPFLMRRHSKPVVDAPAPLAVDAPPVQLAGSPVVDAKPKGAQPKKEQPLVPRINAMQLPSIDMDYKDADHSLATIASLSSQLVAHVRTIEVGDREALTRKRTEYQQRLEQQARGSEEVNATNAKIAAEIAELRKGNGVMRARASLVQQDNARLRAELRDVEARLGAGDKFIKASMASTDDSRAKELTILKPPPPPRAPVKRPAPALVTEQAKSDDSTQDSDEDSSDDDTSFLAISESHVSKQRVFLPDSTTESLTGNLNRNIRALAKSVGQSPLDLEKDFRKAFQAGQQLRNGLLSQQLVLTAQKNALAKEGLQIKKADEHLEQTRSTLEARLKSLAIYFRPLVHVADAPVAPKESQKLIAEMPRAVPVF